jgi:4-hydroxymandelate oxidase
MQRTREQNEHRRGALRALAGFAASACALSAQQDPFRDHSRVPKLDELHKALDFEAVAYARLPRYAYDYTAYGTDGEFTLRRNRAAFDWVRLLPGAAGPAAIDTSLELFGQKMAFPLLISPSAAHTQLHPDGEMATHEGATKASDTTMIISNVASNPVDKIAAAATGPVWFQLYPREDMESNRETLDRAQAAGCRAIVVTIDQQAAVFERALHDRALASAATGPRRTSTRGPALGPYRVSQGRLWYEWKLFGELRKLVKVPLIAKGVLTPEDARLCLEHGLDGIYVSNHGGRSLDYGPSTLEVLPEIVDAVAGRAPVLFDSGVRGGADALKALALGARAVALGRLPRWGLAAYGAPGVEKILRIVQEELRTAMRACGRANLAQLDRSLVRTDFP